MNITGPLVKLIPLWVADLRVKRKPDGEPYSEGTLDKYAKRANTGFLSLDCAPTKASFKQYLYEEQKLVDYGKMASRY